MWVGICGALLATACGPVARGAFATENYAAGYGYQVAYQTGTRRVLPPDWAVDNFYFDGQNWVRKNRGDYVTAYELDKDNDGRRLQRVEIYTYELRYEHRVHSGMIWLRSIPISATLRSKDLRVLMQSYIDQIAGATYETVRFGSSTAPVVVERRQAALIVEEGPATVAGRPAYVATIEVANVDQLKLAPGVRSRRVQLVLMRAPEDERLERDGRPTLVHPVVVLAGYSNMPTDFGVGLPDFHGFLQRLTVAGKTGLTLNTAPATPSPEPQAPAAPASSSPLPAASAAAPTTSP